MPVSLQIDGMDTMQMFLRNVSPRVTAFLTDSMTQVSEEVFAVSQIQVPVDTSALKNSGHVDPPNVSPGHIEILIGYGMDYALQVHEDLSAKHKGGTKAKYLEDPMNDALSKLTYRVAGRMEAALVGEFNAGASFHTSRSTANVRSGSDLRARHNVQHARTVLNNVHSARAGRSAAYKPYKASGGQGPHNRGTSGGGGKS